MNKFGIQIERINKYNPLDPLSKVCYFKSIFQSPFMSTFLMLHRNSVFLFIYLM